MAALRLSSYSPRAAGLVRIQAGCAQVPLQLGGRALVDERFLAAAHARDLQVHVWTVDTEEETTAMLDLGVDGIMTDRPAMLRELLEKRGQWLPAVSGLAERLRHWRPRTPLRPRPGPAREARRPGLVRPRDGHRRRTAVVVLDVHAPQLLLAGQRDANRARYRIAAAITRGLVPLRAGEADRPPSSTARGPPRPSPPTPVVSFRRTSRDGYAPVLDRPPAG